MPESGYIQFVKNQQDIYRKNFLENPQLRTVGTCHHGLNGQAGYLVAFRYDSVLTQAIERASKKLAEHAPLLVYPSRNIHTTLADCEFGNGFALNHDKLDNIADCVQECLPSLRKPNITYETWLANQNSVIVTGTSDPAFLDAAKIVHEETKKRGIDTRLPWGSHITAGRFIGKRSATQLEQFFEALTSPWETMKVQPVAIDVGYHSFKDDGFEFNVVKRFDLK